MSCRSVSSASRKLRAVRKTRSITLRVSPEAALAPVWTADLARILLDLAMDRVARRSARANWESRVYRGPNAWEEAADDDARFWDGIPVEERARVAWELSAELFAASGDEGDFESRLPRSAYGIQRR
jgi:hypothetical protein